MRSSSSYERSSVTTTTRRCLLTAKIRSVFLSEEFARDINLVVKFRALRDLILKIIATRRDHEKDSF